MLFTSRLARQLPAFLILLCQLSFSHATLQASETSDGIVLKNDRLHVHFNKSTAVIDDLLLDDQDFLGVQTGSIGIGPYLDCYCIPSGVYQAGTTDPAFELIQGKDSTGTPYAAILLNDTYTPTGQFFQQWWFLRGEETGLHTFSRLAYYNETTPFLRNLQEMRTLMRPNTKLWTHLMTNQDFYAPLPIPDPAATGSLATDITVQDATWYLGNRTDDPYVESTSDYFTKYTFQDTWRDHDVHGLFADGSESDSGDTFGAWLVMNTRDSYWGGPLHSDLIVDGILYNYMGE
jgi:rhamnogalacturonan endolyase